MNNLMDSKARKARFKPRADAGLLSKLVQNAWTDYQDRISSEEKRAEVAEIVTCYFESVIPPSDLEVLARYNCVAYHEACNVAVYDVDRPTGAYAERFGVDLPRKVPCVGNGGYGYPSLAACEPEWGTKSHLRDLDSYFMALLVARKQYKAEYKESTAWPSEYGKEHGQYPTWGEIEDRFPVLGSYIAGLRAVNNAA